MSKFIVNSFQLPNALVDELFQEMSGNDLKCYVFITRKTRGWQKSSDAISLSQFAKGVNLSKNTVLDCCERLESLNLIRTKKITSEKRNETTIFFLTDLPSSKNEPVDDRVVQKLNKGSSKIELESGSKIEHTEIQDLKYTNINTNTPLPPKGESAIADGVADENKKIKSKRKSEHIEINYQEVLDSYNALLEKNNSSLPRAEILNSKRRQAIKSLAMVLRNKFGQGNVNRMFLNYFADFLKSARDFYFGNNDRRWRANFDYLLQERTFIKTYEESL